jgi:hypothetical protein
MSSAPKVTSRAILLTNLFVPLISAAGDEGTLSRSDFRWDRRRGLYICPNGKVLHTTGKVHEGKTLRYLASKYDCDVCALKMLCCPNSPSRQIPRDVHEYARDVTRQPAHFSRIKTT